MHKLLMKAAFRIPAVRFTAILPTVIEITNWLIIAITTTYKYSGGKASDPETCYVSCARQGITQGTDKNLTIGITRGDICMCGMDFETNST